MTFKSESARDLANKVKSIFYSAFSDSPYTEEQLARTLGVSQQYVSNMMNPDSERQVPLWLLAKLHKDMARPVASSVLRLNGLDVRDLRELPTVNGTIADEVRELTVRLGKLAEREQLNPQNIPTLRKVSRSMRDALDQLDHELDVAEAKP
jgi:transcriptional regulator with XRE-family HTH domain